MKYFSYYIIIFVFAGVLASCSHSRKFTHTYYQENDSLFQSVNHRYKKLYEEHPFSIAMKDKTLEHLAFEIITDSIKYVYNFAIDEPRFTDTLIKYKFDVKNVSSLINDMRAIHCTWITNLDYYEKQQKKYLVFVSIRHKKLKAFLRSEKYFTLAFFDRPQRFDARGRLLDNVDRKNLFRINGALFRRINDRVCYSLSASFR
jgi:hypothetical protein